MRLILFFFAYFFAHNAANADDLKCEQVLSVLGNFDPKQLGALFSFKKQTLGRWILNDNYQGVPFSLRPTKTENHKLKWKIKNQSFTRENLGDGELNCEIPSAWKLELRSPLKIVYPSVTHGQHEDTTLHDISTFAGIYLGKSKFKITPDVVQIMWHLHEEPLPNKFTEISDLFPFIPTDKLVINKDLYVKSDEIQLVAFNLSPNQNTTNGEQRWLITNAKDLTAIKDERYATAESKHNAWLPWHDQSRREFQALSPVEAYKSTVLAPLDQSKIFDRGSEKFVPEPLSVADKMQSVYDLIAPLVKRRRQEAQPLFAHLLFKLQKVYLLASFEIRADGIIEAVSSTELADPSQIGLPSASVLGFLQSNEL